MDLAFYADEERRICESAADGTGTGHTKLIFTSQFERRFLRHFQFQQTLPPVSGLSKAWDVLPTVGFFVGGLVKKKVLEPLMKNVFGRGPPSDKTVTYHAYF